MKYDYCLYARKSTESDEKQALSIDSQIKEMMAIAERDDLKVVAVKKESRSAKDSGTRPVFNEIIQDLKDDKYQGLITWSTDRLSRCGGDLGLLIDLIDQRKLAEIRTFNQTFTNTPNDKFLLMILGSQAKLENDNRAINVVRGMKASCELGVRPCMPPLGYKNDPYHPKGMKKITLDPERAPYIKKMFEMSAKGISGRKILDWAGSVNFATRSGQPLTITVLYRTLKNPYFYGKFEWPVKSGNWYDVDHASIVTKELYDKVQKNLGRVPKGRKNTKPFNYSGTLKCGECGSSITAEEKFRDHTDGTRARHVCYMCSKYTKRECKQKPINEKDLILQLVKMMDGVNIDKFLLRKEYEYEVDKYRKYSNELSAKYQKEAKENIDVRSQMKYVVANGTPEERQRLLKNLGTKVFLKDKYIFLR